MIVIRIVAILALLFTTARVASDGGSCIDPHGGCTAINGGGAMDPNGGNADSGGGMDPNG